jgi:hypothetical protein
MTVIPGLWAATSFGVSYYLGLALLIISMVVALVAAYRVWEEIHDVEEPDTPSDLLESFEQAHASGVLNDQEFDRVRRRLEESSRSQEVARPSRAAQEESLGRSSTDAEVPPPARDEKDGSQGTA